MAVPRTSDTALLSRWSRWQQQLRATGALGDRALAEGLGPRGLGTRLDYAWRLALHQGDYRRLLAAFQATPALAAALQATPQLAFKVLHPCFVAGLGVAERADRVIGHHRLALGLLGADGYRSVYVGSDGLPVGQVVLPGGQGVLPLRLVRYPPAWREGEATLALFDPFGTVLYTLTFSLQQGASGAPSNAPSFWIGSLIGVTSLDNIRHLTKLMQGLRPQGLMVQAAQMAAAALGCGSVQAVGRAGHVFAGTDRAGRLQFDYDAFWLEQGGTPLDPAGRLWSLPLVAERRSEVDTPSHKRAQYRRRHAMLDALAAEIARHLAGEPGSCAVR
jgi:uncharacterized protein VirK/YbjX